MKVGLVLEGGGLRGAYTAGVLAWFLEEEIDFDYQVGISSGAQHLSNYLTKDKKYLKEIATVIGAQEFTKGLKPLLKEGSLVGYNHLFDHVLKNVAPLDLEKIRANKSEGEIGIYDLKAGKTIWVNTKDIDDDYQKLKAASLIPIAGKPVVIDNVKYVDAGGEYMIPIERSIEKKMDKHIVVTTKPSTYERPETGFLTNLYFSIFYRPYKTFRNLIKNRRSIYLRQKGIVKQLVLENKALEIFPSKEFSISRFGGDLDELLDLYETGFNDCEKRRKEIYEFLEIGEN